MKKEKEFNSWRFIFFALLFAAACTLGGYTVGRYVTRIQYDPDQRVPEWAEELARHIPALDDRYPRRAIKDLSTKFSKAEVVGKVTLVQNEPDGDIHVVLADGPYRVVTEIIPELRFVPPEVGDIIIARGLVWFDEDHKWWELHPLISWEKVQ